MTTGWLAAAFALSVAVPVGERWAPGLVEARGSLALLALLPWLALASLPRRARSDGSAWRATALVACFALPPLLLGVGVDLARGAAPRELALAAGSGFGALLLWCGAAEAAAATPARSAHAYLWLALVPGPAALCAALAWVPLRGGVTADSTLLFALDPLVWCHRAAPALESAAGEYALVLFAPALVGIVVLALRRERPR